MKHAILLVGLGCGDEGKGSMTDYFTRLYKADLVVRFNGGPQSAHNVVTPGGLHHTFSSFGSGTLAGARTHLSEFMLVDPLALNREAMALMDKRIYFDPISISPGALVLTPFHQICNRAREEHRGDRRHGSVGLGIGELRDDEEEGRPLLRVGHVRDGQCLELLLAIQAVKIDYMECWGFKKAAREIEAINIISLAREYEEILSRVEIESTRVVLDRATTAVFEGAQGILLDQDYGFYPYNSWTDCTLRNAKRLIVEGTCHAETLKIGVIRRYFTKHGPGPFVTESPHFYIPEMHNGTHPWMGKFRLGHFDMVALRYALKAVGPLDGLALTHMDRKGSGLIATKYSTGEIERYKDMEVAAQVLSKTTPVYEPCEDVLAAIKQHTGADILFESWGPTWLDKKVCEHVKLTMFEQSKEAVVRYF